MADSTADSTDSEIDSVFFPRSNGIKDGGGTETTTRRTAQTDRKTVGKTDNHRKAPGGKSKQPVGDNSKCKSNDGDNSPSQKEKGKGKGKGKSNGGGKNNQNPKKTNKNREGNKSEANNSDEDDEKVVRLGRRPKPLSRHEWEERHKQKKRLREQRKKEEEDPNYESDSENSTKLTVVGKENKVSVDDIKQKSNSQRVRTAKELNNDCMWKDKDGKIAIAKLSYDPETRVTDDKCIQVIGSKALQLTDQQKEEVCEWFRQLKKNALDYGKKRYCEEILANAATENLGITTLEGLQDVWANATTDKERESAGETLTRLWSSGYFAKGRGIQNNGGWKFVMEKEMMEKFGLTYLSEDAQSKTIGCLARQATRCGTDMRKAILEKGKRIHGMSISRRRGVLEKGPGWKRDRSKEVKGNEFIIRSSLDLKASKVKKIKNGGIDWSKVCVGVVCVVFKCI
jgi:hypothetical protein